MAIMPDKLKYCPSMMKMIPIDGDCPNIYPAFRMPPSQGQVKVDKNKIGIHLLPVLAKPSYPITQGLRDDKNKIGIHLLPVLALEEVAKVLDYGKNKYTTDQYDATDNWRKGLKWRATTGSLLRHAFSFLRGEDRDPESGLYHMAHVAANALFILQFLIEGIGTDDRYKESKQV